MKLCTCYTLSVVWWLHVCGNRHMAFHTLLQAKLEATGTMTQMRSCELLTWEGKEKSKINGWIKKIRRLCCMWLKQNEYFHPSPYSPLFSSQFQTQPNYEVRHADLTLTQKKIKNMFLPTVCFIGLTPCPHLCLSKTADMSPLVYHLKTADNLS